ncbi:hypothetical protein GCM10010520_55140 [Rhizobium viscosum]
MTTKPRKSKGVKTRQKRSDDQDSGASKAEAGQSDATELYTKLSNAAEALVNSNAVILETEDSDDTMVGRVARCGKPAVQIRVMPDGSRLECYLQSDCTYAGCVPVR